MMYCGSVEVAQVAKEDDFTMAAVRGDLGFLKAGTTQALQQARQDSG
jgi:hypothetical protein